MHTRTSLSKLSTMVAILATAAASSALAGTAQAQISGTTGGDIVAKPTMPAHGGVAFPSGFDKANAWLTGTF
jgi:hypothetical protein